MSLDNGELTILNKTLTNMLYRLQGQTTSN
jgi:MarR family transcriptional regulator, organic hydroperoxide resistance regulator